MWECSLFSRREPNLNTSMDDYKAKLIELVRERPLLWNPRVPDYKDKDKKAQVWEYLAKILTEPTGTTHKETWISLIRGHCNALKRTKKKSGSRADNSKPWRFLKQMEFLIPAKNIRYSKGNLTKETSEETKTDIVHTALEEADIESEDDGVAVNEEAVPMTMTRQRGEEAVPMTMTRQRGEEAVPVAMTRQRGEEAVPVAMTRQRGEEAVPMTMTRQRGEEAVPVAVRRKRREEGRRKQKTKKVEDNEGPILSLMKKKLEGKPESPRMGFFNSIMPRVETLKEDLFHEFQVQILQLLQTLHTRRAQQGHFSRQSSLSSHHSFTPIPSPLSSSMPSPSPSYYPPNSQRYTMIAQSRLSPMPPLQSSSWSSEVSHVDKGSQASGNCSQFVGSTHEPMDLSIN